MTLEKALFDAPFLLLHALPLVGAGDPEDVEGVVDERLFDLAVQTRVGMKRRTVVYLRRGERGNQNPISPSLQILCDYPDNIFIRFSAPEIDTFYTMLYD